MVHSPKLSKSNILQDPLIKQLMKADGVNPLNLATLMEEVSSRLKTKLHATQQPTTTCVPVNETDRPRNAH